MALITKSFTDVGAGGSLHVQAGDKFNYSVSGTFDATWILEKSKSLITWQQVATGTAASTGTVEVDFSDKGKHYYRYRCSVFDSGTVVTSMNDENFKSQQYIIPAAGLAKAGTTAGFVVAAGDNLALVTCPASQTASTLVLPVIGLKVGWQIKAFSLIGQVESAGNTVTVDCALRRMTAAAADVTDAAVATMTQLSLTADAKLSSSNTLVTGLTELVGVDETFYFLITATTGASTDIALQGVLLTIEEV